MPDGRVLGLSESCRRAGVKTCFEVYAGTFLTEAPNLGVSWIGVTI